MKEKCFSQKVKAISDVIRKHAYSGENSEKQLTNILSTCGWRQKWTKISREHKMNMYRVRSAPRLVPPHVYISIYNIWSVRVHAQNVAD